MSQPQTGDPPPQGIEPPPLPPPPIPPTTPPPPPVIDFLDDEERSIGVTVTDGNRASVPQDSFRKIKDKAAQRARDKVLAEQTERAKALGFADFDTMLAQLERKEIIVTTPNQPAPLPAAPVAAAPAPALVPAPVDPKVAAPPSSDPAEDRNLTDSQRRRLRQHRQEMSNQAAAAKAKADAAELTAKSATTQLETFRAEQTLRDDILLSGCTDVEYVFEKLLRKHLGELAKDKTPEGDKALKEFSAKTWAEKLKAEKPYLFGSVAAPANTGHPPIAAGDPPKPQTPAEIAAAAAAGARKNASQMSPAEWAAYKKANNLNI